MEDHNIDESYEELSNSDQEFIMEIISKFHIRDGKKHPDGSMGTIDISPKQLRNCIAYAFWGIMEDYIVE